MTDLKRAPFRIAIRAEGAMVNAYIADHGTMEGAALIASISRAACDRDRDVFDTFCQLVQRIVRTAIQQYAGDVRVDMEPEPAPEHERAGHA